MNYDEIGLIVDTPATFDDEGNQLTAATFKQGWHVNTQVPNEEWAQYRVYPNNHYRVYAGGVAPVCYQFPDQKTFKKFVPSDEEIL